jgi:hypothetical protein
MSKPASVSLKVEQSRHELRALNDRFRSRELLPEPFYAELRQHGCEPDRCVLVQLMPEGARTYSGKIIRHDGVVLSFDVDLDAPELSQWVDTTGEFEKENRRLAQRQPWASAVVAYELFRALRPV